MHSAILYSRPDCHLCHRAREVLTALADDYPMQIAERDIDADPALLAEFGDRIPVVELDGCVIAEGRVSEYRLRRLLGIPATPRRLIGLVRSALRGDQLL